MGYEKINEAPPPYSINAHEHVDYSGAASAAACAPQPAVAPVVNPDDVTIAIPVVYSGTVPMYAVTDQKRQPTSAGKTVLQEFGNITFLLLGVGLGYALIYIFLCLALCMMLIGLPYAKMLMHHAVLCLRPYGSELDRPHRFKPGVLYTCLNLFWAITFGWMMAAMHFLLGVGMFASLIFIPFGIVHFKLGVRIMWPMGIIEEEPVELVPTMVTTVTPAAMV